MRLSALPLLALLAAPPPASSSDLCEQAGKGGDCLVQPAAVEGRPASATLAAKPSCPEDWRARRRGDCLAEDSILTGRPAPAYVHPGGWVIDPRCLADPRFAAEDLLQALTAAHRKMDPKVRAAKGGCLSRFNPQWGAELVEAIWSRRMYVVCPAFDASSTTCADTGDADRGLARRLSLRNVAACVGKDTTGLAGVLFHETLHAAGADNFSAVKHNTAWNLPQYEFVRDRIYGTEAVCFFGLDPKKTSLVNFLQCKNAAEYRAERARDSLCDPFPASFTDMPAGFWKH